MEHALSCPYGGFPTIRSKRDITAHLLTDVCQGVVIKAQGFCEKCAYFDVQVFNSLAHTHHCLPLPTCYRRHEQEKRRAYDQRIREVEHGCFSPLVFSVSGVMDPTAKVVYKKLASMIASKHNQPYSQTIHWLRCRLRSSLLFPPFSLCVSIFGFVF